MALDPPSSAEAGDPRAHRGRCHCGALSFTFWTARPLRPRACQCSFCRKHSARTVSDAEGKATIHLAVPLDSAAYRFASRQADYLVCPGCGVYIGALIPTPGGSFATLNLNAFEKPHPELAAEPVSYDAQSAEEKLARRMGMWTPTTVVGPASGAG